MKLENFSREEQNLNKDSFLVEKALNKGKLKKKYKVGRPKKFSFLIFSGGILFLCSKINFDKSNACDASVFYF